MIGEVFLKGIDGEQHDIGVGFGAGFFDMDSSVYLCVGVFHLQRYSLPQKINVHELSDFGTGTDDLFDHLRKKH